MTSTTSSKNKNFKKLYKWALERNKRTIIVFSIILVIDLMINLYIFINNKTGINEQLTDISEGRCRIMITFAQVVSILFTIISASRTFSFIHNKRSTDMFGAIPATRSTLYFSHLFGGITSVSIPYISFCLISTAVFCHSGNYLIINLLLILAGLISIAAVYSFSSLIAYCCGTIRDSMIINIAVNAIYFGVLILFYSIATTMIPGLNMGNIGNSPIFILLSPLIFCVYFDIFILSEMVTEIITLFVWSAVYTAAVIFLGNYAAKTRKAETAQNEFNIKWLPVVIKTGMSVLCGSFAGLLAAMSSSAGFYSMFIFAFWYILIGFAAMFILHLIFAKGVKGKFKSTLIAYACTTVGVIGIIFAMSTGLGIDTYVPNDSNIKSVTFSDTTYTDPENIKTVTEIQRTVIDGIMKEHPRPYYLGSSTHYGHSAYLSQGPYIIQRTKYEFRYDKKIGFTTERNYSLYNCISYDNDKLEQLLKTLYNSEEYKRITQPFLFGSDDKNISGSIMLTYYEKRIQYSTNEYIATDSFDLNTNKKFLEKLYDALRTDILNDNNYYINEHAARYGNLSELSDVRYMVLTLTEYSGYQKTIIIPDDYTNTTECIKKYFKIQ